MIRVDTQTRDELIKRLKAVINNAFDMNADTIMAAIRRNHRHEKKLRREYSRLNLITTLKIRTDGNTFQYNGNIEWGYETKDHAKTGDGYYNPLEIDLFEGHIEAKPLQICESCMPKKDTKNE